MQYVPAVHTACGLLKSRAEADLVCESMVPVRAHYVCEVGREKEGKRWRWVLPYSDPCRCTQIRFGGSNAYTPKRTFDPGYVDNPLFGDDVEKIRKHYGLDCTAPEIAPCPVDQELETYRNKSFAIVIYQTPNATDNFGEVSVVCDPESESNFAIGNTTVTCVARDGSGNSAMCKFKVSVKDNCLHQLGMEDGRIKNEQITSSSAWSSTNVWNTGPQNARLNHQEIAGVNAGSWVAATNDLNPWIQVNLGATMWVSGVMIQGRNSEIVIQMVTQFKVAYNIYGSEWKHVTTVDNEDDLIFEGNTDRDTIETRLFPSPIRATVIRILPIMWVDYASMRFDLIGCEAPQDCYEILNTHGRNTGGIYWIYPIINGTSTPTPIQVWCDMDTEGGGWTVFQRRVDGSEDFFRYWADYKAGFGNLAVEHWLGNDNIYALVNNGKTYELRLDLYDSSDYSYDLYASFVISDEASDYTLTLGAHIDGGAGDSFTSHNSMGFTTRDADNDVWNKGNCARAVKGGWWYVACHRSNLNGLYLNGGYTASYRWGIEYEAWKGQKYSLAATEMKVRPAP
ncbi:uncharacterized protein [Amphiura filiformis]|uniref:uncharacterized protein n=1 Tax=Amphiura filiformis TaxID=82378 RepID=UPI003B20CF4B